MANGSDGNEYKEISRVRPGLKREFAFALKSKAEYRSSIGCARTRRSRRGISGSGKYELNIEDEEPKLEMEGSENTTLKKIPTKLKELLETGLLEGISVRYQYGAKSKGKNGDGLEGKVSATGITCFCLNCNGDKVVSPNDFECHAGSRNKRPADSIYLKNGRSLRDVLNACKMAPLEALESLIQSMIVCTTSPTKQNVFCQNCESSIAGGSGEEMLLCSSCKESQRSPAASVEKRSRKTLSFKTPNSDFACSSRQERKLTRNRCQSMIERQKFVETNANAKVAGRNVRISEALEADHGGCVLCRGHDFSPSGFGPQTIIICYQCEKEYHVRCLKEHEMDDLKELPLGKWFCCKDCSRIYSALEERVAIGDNFVPESSLLNILETDNFYISWRLLSGRSASNEDHDLLSEAVCIFHDRFDPVLTSNSEVGDLIPHMVYGRKVEGYDFGRMYCAVMKANFLARKADGERALDRSLIVSAAIIRIFGEEMAELPLVATSIESQGQGYFQILFSCLENLLLSLNVKKLVVPAANEAESLWTNKFGFSKIKNDELMNYHKDYQMMVFQKTTMLQKSLGSS